MTAEPCNIEGFNDLSETLDMAIKAASHSRLVVFETCKFQAKLKYIDKIPEPERPLPPGKTEHANDRGTRIHTGAELFVKGGVELIDELKDFEPEFQRLKTLFAQGKVSLEGEWAFDKDWEPVAWMSSDAKWRIKLDACAFLTKAHAAVIDYKSGKRWGNEVKHGEQMQLYVLAAFLKYPHLEKVTVELWYTDLNELIPMTYTQAQSLRFLKGFENRAQAMFDEEVFKPNPTTFTCRYCAYKPKEKGGTGDCGVGV